MNKETNAGRSKAPIAVAAIVGLLVLAAVAAYAMNGKKDEKQTASTSPSPTVAATTSSIPTPTVAGAETSSAFKDGAYTATGSYQSPGGDESIDVNLTLKGGVISDVNVTGKATLPNSKVYQAKFIGGVKEAVVGKSIEGLKLDKVAGSSLTPQGFNDALDKIKGQAKA